MNSAGGRGGPRARMSREHRAEKAEHGGGDRERGEATGGDGQVQAVLPRRVRARRCDLCAACGGPCCSVGAEDGQGETGPEPLDGRRVDARARLVISSRAVTDVTLLAVPNVSEGRHDADVAAIGTAFTSHGARLLDTHSDPDHHRTVYTLAGRPGELSASLVGGARETLRRVDLARPRGVHPHVGALDVVPLVHLDQASRGAACAEALVVADRLGDELGLPVLLYGALAGGAPAQSCAVVGPWYWRRGCAAASCGRTSGQASRMPPVA